MDTIQVFEINYNLPLYHNGFQVSAIFAHIQVHCYQSMITKKKNICLQNLEHLVLEILEGRQLMEISGLISVVTKHQTCQKCANLY